MNATIQKIIEEISALSEPIDHELVQEISQEITEKISALSEPIDHELVQEIFKPYRKLFSTLFSSDLLLKDLNYTWVQLDLLRQFGEKATELTSKIEGIKLHENDIKIYTEQKTILEKELAELEIKSIQLQEKTTYARTKLTNLYNDLLSRLEQESTITENSPQGITQKQLATIIEISQSIEREINVIKLPAIKLDLLKLKNDLSELRKQLTSHYSESEFPSDENKDAWEELQSSLAKRLNTINALTPKLNSLQASFAEHLSIPDTEKKLKNLEQSAEQIATQLKEIIQEKEIHTLVLEQQEHIKTEYENAKNKKELLERYQNKVDTIFAYIDLNAWTTWGSDYLKYNKEQKEHALCLNFLNLLIRHEELLQEQLDIQHQIERFTPISKPTAMSHADEETLIAQTRDLINKLPDSIVPQDFKAQVPIADYYLLLINNIMLIPNKAKQHEAAIELINKMLPLIDNILKYRREYNLPLEQDGLLPSIETLKEAIQEESILAEKQKQLEICKQYKDEVKSLITIKKQTEEVELHIKLLNASLENKKDLEIKKTFAQQIVDLSDRLTTNQKDMINVREKIILAANTSPKTKSDETNTSQSSSIHNNYDSMLPKIEEKQQETVSQEAYSVDPELIKELQDEHIFFPAKNSELNKESFTREVPPENSETSLPLNISMPMVTERIEQNNLMAAIIDESVTNQTSTTRSSLNTTQLSPNESTIARQKPADLKESILDPKESILDLKESSPDSKESILEPKESNLAPKESNFAPKEATLAPKEATLAPKEATLAPKEATLAPKEATLAPKEAILNPKEATLNPKEVTLNPKEVTLNPKEVTLNPKEATLNPKEATLALKEATLAPKELRINTNSAGQNKNTLIEASDKIISSDSCELISPEQERKKQTNEINNTEIMQIDRWHNAILDLLDKQPEEIKNWYLELYSVTELALKQTPYSYKYSHLIRDIFFELQTKQDINLLYIYKNKCPDPKGNCEFLLMYKPNIQISENFSEDLDKEPALPEPLKRLNNQYKNLKLNHPIPAELLLQIIESLYSIYKDPTRNSPTFMMPPIIEDPRYDILKRHRGALKIWEVIEDFCRWILGKITGKPEYEYSKKPCFFKTHTEELVEETELFITCNLI